MVDAQAFTNDVHDTLSYLATAELTDDEWREVRERLERLDRALEALRSASDPEEAAELLEAAEDARSGIETLSYRMTGKPAIARLDPRDELNILIAEIKTKVIEVGPPSEAEPAG